MDFDVQVLDARQQGGNVGRARRRLVDIDLRRPSTTEAILALELGLMAPAMPSAVLKS